MGLILFTYPHNTPHGGPPLRAPLPTQPEYDKQQAYGLLILELGMAVILFVLLIYWHYTHPDSQQVIENYERQLLKHPSLHTDPRAS